MAAGQWASGREGQCAPDWNRGWKAASVKGRSLLTVIVVACSSMTLATAFKFTWHVPAPHPASISLNRVNFLWEEERVKQKRRGRKRRGYEQTGTWQWFADRQPHFVATWAGYANIGVQFKQAEAPEEEEEDGRWRGGLIIHKPCSHLGPDESIIHLDCVFVTMATGDRCPRNL